MTRIQYELNQEDFLNFQLFTASRLESVNRRRKRIRTLVPFIYLALGFWLYFREPDNIALPLFLLLFAVGWYLIFPFFEGRSFRNKLARYIAVNYKDTLPMHIEMTVDEAALTTTDTSTSTRIETSDIERIDETTDYFFVKISPTNQSLIFPKQKIENVAALKTLFEALAERRSIPFELHEGWKWK